MLAGVCVCVCMSSRATPVLVRAGVCVRAGGRACGCVCVGARATSVLVGACGRVYMWLIPVLQMMNGMGGMGGMGMPGMGGKFKKKINYYRKDT